jgi:hypothetical protein
MTRIYHPYYLWEEINAGMWRDVKEHKKEKYIKHAMFFMKHHNTFGFYMKKVIDTWKYSCEHNLTDLNQNRVAWLGQAACAFALRCPEDLTRKAWFHLSDEEMILANKEAEKYIKIWESRHEEENSTRGHQMAIKGIF